MNFLFPLFLIAGLGIAVPIIIHLFNFRKYKKVLFPDIRFLKELKEQTQKQSKLKNLLILLARILALLALVAAFAQPYFKKNNSSITRGPKAVSIYIDNSYSMQVQQSGISVLELAKAKAKEIIETYNETDHFQILSNDFTHSQNKFINKEEALAYIPQINTSGKIRTANEILEKQHQLLTTENESTKQLIFISDFQKTTFASTTTSNDSCKKYFIPIIPKKIKNIILDTCYFETPNIQANTNNKLLVKLRNSSDEEANTSITLLVNKQLKNVVNTSIGANQSKIDSISFTPSKAGYQNIELFINDYPINYDDTFFCSAKVTSNFSVLTINQTNSNAFLNSVFKPNTQFKVDNTNSNAVNSSTIGNYSLVVLNSVTTLSASLSQALTTYVTNGGTILVFAPLQNNTSGINTFLQQTTQSSFTQYDTSKTIVSTFSKEHELFRDMFTKIPDNIDLPVANKHFVISSSSTGSQQKLFTFSNGDGFLNAYRVGAGKMYICASAAEMQASSFPTSYWFLPLLYKMAFIKQSNEINSVEIGSNKALVIQQQKINDKTIYHIANKETDAVPEQRTVGNSVALFVKNAIHKAGIYSIYLPGSTDTLYTGINESRKESDLNYWNIDELKNKLSIPNVAWIADTENAGHSINSLQHGTPLWKLCIVLTLIFLLLEVCLIKLLK